MGAHMPDAYRYAGGQPARAYPQPGAGSSPSVPTERAATYHRADEDRGLSPAQSSPFAPREQQVTPERERVHYDESSVGLAPESSRCAGDRWRDERSDRDHVGSVSDPAPVRPAPRLVAVEQMYVPVEEVEEARRRDAMAYRHGRLDIPAEYCEPRRKKRRWKLGLGMFILGFFSGIIATIVSVVGLAMLVGGQDQAFAQAVTACKAAPHATVASDGSSLEMNTFGKKQPGMSVVTLGCVLQELDAPESLMQRMDTTRAIDGTREETWGSYRATWTYHPDQGLHVVISRE